MNYTHVWYIVMTYASTLWSFVTSCATVVWEPRQRANLYECQTFPLSLVRICKASWCHPSNERIYTKQKSNFPVTTQNMSCSWQRRVCIGIGVLIGRTGVRVQNISFLKRNHSIQKAFTANKRTFPRCACATAELSRKTEPLNRKIKTRKYRYCLAYTLN